jgi:DNA-binding IclR family transcriptional regulator
MRLQTGSAPLVFFRGGYGAFQSSSLVAGDPHGDLAVPLRLVDLGRPLLESFAERSDTNIAVTALVGDQTVVVGVAGASAEDRASGTYIGARVRTVPPIGATFMAWERPERVSAWMAMAPHEETAALAERLDSIRSRGLAFSLEGGGPRDWQDAMSGVEHGQEQYRVLTSRIRQTFHSGVEEPDAARVRNVHVPVFTPDGRAGLFLHVGGFRSLDQAVLAALVADVKGVAAQITDLAANQLH